MAVRSKRTVTIANGASLSDAVNLQEGVVSVVGIQMPATWTTAALTFQASADGTTYSDLYNTSGTEVTIANTVATASRWIALDPADLAGISYLKVRSGTSGAAVNQGGARTITLAVRSV